MLLRLRMMAGELLLVSMSALLLRQSLWVCLHSILNLASLPLSSNFPLPFFMVLKESLSSLNINLHFFKFSPEWCFAFFCVGVHQFELLAAVLIIFFLDTFRPLRFPQRFLCHLPRRYFYLVWENGLTTQPLHRVRRYRWLKRANRSIGVKFCQSTEPEGSMSLVFKLILVLEVGLWDRRRVDLRNSWGKNVF